MSIVKILDAYEEFQAILFEVGNEGQVNDSLTDVNIEMKKDISLELLRKLSGLVKNFEVLCNPFPDDCDVIIDDLINGEREINDIESISILLEKNFFVDDIGELDYYFFDFRSALKSIETIGKSKNGNKINIGIPSNEFIETDTLVFISLNKETNLSKIKKISIDSIIDENINFYLSNNKKSNHSYYFNPYSFLIKEVSYDETPFVKSVKMYFYNTMLDSLSDKKEDSLFILRGEKSISILIDNDFQTDNYQDFIKIFSFLVSVQKYTEKYIIIKKVFSLYILNKEDITALDQKLPDIRKTINHYYDHYIEDNIKDFFRTKDQLLKEAMNVSKVIYEQTDKINTSIVASLLSIIIIFVTTLYRTMADITLTYFASILIIFVVFSLVYYYLMSNSSEKRYKLTKKQFEHFINEVALIQGKEIKKLKFTYLDAPYEELKSTLKKLLYFLIIINVLIIVSFIIFLFNKVDMLMLLVKIIYWLY
ncbi:hypothetical protein [Paraliobacillus sediminis]|uniref:hypothetical protein n=1 Tax=Paraliobacillus sediminis TaxID=1885916 RepID=UPI000E3DD784|nr:hypothetical protein [Paraliobacillus sediminis]